MKLQRWKIKLNEFDYHINYVPGKENHVADALSRIKLDENLLGETPNSTVATIHSAQEDNQNYISITEKPINYYNRQIEFIKNNINKVNLIKYFQKTKIQIFYKEMTNIYAKELIKEYLCIMKSVIFFHNEADFLIFQTAFIKIISPSNLTKVMKSTKIRIDLKSYAEFKEFVVKTHKQLLHPGIEKLTLLFKEKYYYLDYQNLIQNIINECQICNLAKTEHRNIKLPFELTAEIFNPREKYIIDSSTIFVVHKYLL